MAERRMRAQAFFACAAILIVPLGLSACGVGGAARAVAVTSNSFERGECLSRQLKTGEPCDQDEFKPE